MKKIFFFIFSLLLVSSVSADIPPKPGRDQLVHDLAGILSTSTESAIETDLQDLARTTGAQIVVLTVPTLDGEDKSTYAFRVIDQWGIGQAEEDNGLLILVKPKYADEKGEVFIVTGRGMEGVIPDAVAKQIVEYEMIPRFKENDYDGGVVSAVKVCRELAAKEYSASDYEQRAKRKKFWKDLLPALFVVLIIFFFIFGVPALSAGSYARTNNLSFWAAYWLLMSSSRSHGGYYGGFSGGSSSGGWGGGGFGGFGGGSSGGGGAGGSW